MQKKLQPWRWIILAIGIVTVGIVVTILNVQYTDRQVRMSLRSRAETIAAGIHADVIKQLSGSTFDLKTHNYSDIKREIMNIRSVNPDARFVYLMGLKNNKLFFYADSEPPESKDYSAPGDIYTDASQLKVNNAKGGNPFVEGPYTDVWGTWISGYAPIFDYETPIHGQKPILATVGIDVSATAWENQLFLAAFLPLSITFFIALVLFLYYRWRQRQLTYINIVEMQE